MKKYLWIVLSLIFFALSVFHFIQSTRKIPKPKNSAGIKRINGVNLGIDEFIKDFGKYIDDSNIQNQRINTIAATGYFAAFLTSLLSI